MEPVTLRDWRSAGIPLVIVSVLPLVAAGTLVTTPALGVAAIAAAVGLMCLVAAWNCLGRRVTLSAGVVDTESPLGGKRRLVLEHLATLRLQEHRIFLRATGGMVLLIRDRAGNQASVYVDDKAGAELLAPWVKSVSASLAKGWLSQLNAAQTVAVSSRISLGRERLKLGRRSMPLAPHFEITEYSSWLTAVLEVRNGKDLLSIHGEEENYLPLREALVSLREEQRLPRAPVT